MAFEKCSKCGFMHYGTDPCKESTAAISTLHPQPASLAGLPEATASGSSLPAPAANQLERTTSKAVEPDDISKSPVRSSTPKPKRDRNAYMRQYMANRRTKLKAKGVNA